MYFKLFIKENFTNFLLFCLRLDVYVKFHLFYLFFFFFLLSVFSLILIFISNPVYSVISLIVIYFFSAFILICFEMHFLGVVFILIYLGAVIVLFLFIVMMLNIKVQNSAKIFNVIPFFLLMLGFFFFFKGVFDFKQNILINYQDLDYKSIRGFDLYSVVRFYDIFSSGRLFQYVLSKKENYILFSILLYNYFYCEIIIASFILLLAMIGCISITLVDTSEVKITNRKKQEPIEQLLNKNFFFKKSN
jgi:NADH:ubiquinone oxidoreductase subunit 6 (subunit J)